METWQAYVNGMPVSTPGTYQQALFALSEHVYRNHEGEPDSTTCSGGCHSLDCCGGECWPEDCMDGYMAYVERDIADDDQNDWRNVGGRFRGVWYHIAPA
jgi:hypothetical protein